MKHLNLTLIALLLSFASFAIGPVTGSSSVCVGASTPLADTTAGGTWSSATTTVAVISPGGIVTGIVAGTTTIVYTVGGATATLIITVLPLPAPITGSPSVCIGATAVLTDATPGGIWSAAVPVIATISPASGAVTGAAAGTTTITYALPATGCAVTTIETVNATPAPITGTATICDGASTTLSEAVGGGTWTSSDVTVATVGPTGITSGISPGTAVITYSAATCTATRIVTVMPAPGSITGPTSVCDGGTIIETDVTPGGTWSSSNPLVASVGSTGVVTGTIPGIATITYAAGGLACSASEVVTVVAAPAAIAGTLGVCVGGTTALSDAGGGTWTSSAPGIAIVGIASGIVTGNALGTATIQYSLGTGCTASAIVTVNAGVAAISGSTGTCVGSSVTLTDVAAGGLWISSNPSVAAIDPATGVVTGLTAGTLTISYTLGSGCAATMPFAVGALPFVYAVTGGGTSCSGTGVGIHVGLTGSTPGIVYQLIDGGVLIGTLVAGSGSSIDFGALTAAGVYTVVATDAATGCSSTMTGSATITVAASPAVHNVTGGGAYCAGGTGVVVGLDGSAPGIIYQLYDGLTPESSPVAGTGLPLSFGLLAAGGTYTVSASDPASGCASTMTGSAVITVNPAPVIYTVTGTGGYCSGTAGLHVGLDGSDAGISYQLYSGGSTVGGPVTGTAAALDMGIYTAGTYTATATNITTTCTSNMTGSAVITATTLTPAVTFALSATGAICAGTSVTFTPTPVNGGTPTYAWTVNGVSVSAATTYTYAPVNGDMVDLVMTSSLSCASPATASFGDTLTVITTTVTASSTSACGGTDMIVAGGGASYSWAPSTGLSCPTCDTITVNPAATVVYTVTGTDIHGCAGTATVTANGNRVSGHVNIGTATGSVKVWLIQYNPTDSSLAAMDSTMTCMDGGMPYYEFDGSAAGSYLVKANLLGGTPGTSGYIPTYGVSSATWNTATNLTHSSGTDTMHVDMIYGTVPSGPGFIGGLIVSGAGRNTTDDIPVVGMIVYLKDAVTGNILTYAYTNSAGQYSFGSLANGSYIIYPESYDYYTTPAYVITLSADNESVTAIDFKQHTTGGTITPYTVSIVKPLTAANGLNVYPNPTSGNLNIQWNNLATGSANVAVTDIAGRAVYTSAININTTSGQAQIDLSGLTNGLYLISIRSGSNSYNGKLMIQQ